MWGFDDGELRVADLKYDSSRIKDYYLRHGYLDVKVSNPFLKAYMDGYTAKIVYNIEEGEQYRVGKVDIVVPKGLIDTKEILEDILLQPDRVFSIKGWEKIQSKKIEDSVANLG